MLISLKITYLLKKIYVANMLNFTLNGKNTVNLISPQAQLISDELP